MTTIDVTPDRLRAFVERLEQLEKEKAEIGLHIRETYAEAKGEGFDVRVLRMVLRLRKLKPEAREELDTLTSLYLSALEGVHQG